MVTLYNVVSSDGYIAREDGSEDFIPDGLWTMTLDVFKKFDVLVMGRKTYETLQTYGEELLNPFEKLPIKKVVVSRDKNLNVKPGYVIVQAPEEAITYGSGVLVSTGPTLNNYFLEAGLADEVLFHEIPVTINNGIPAFDSRFRKSLILQSKSDIGLIKEIKYRLRK